MLFTEIFMLCEDYLLLHCLLCEDLDKQTCGPLPSYLLGTISVTKTYMWPLAYLSVLYVECSSLQNLLAISLFILVLSKLFTIRIYSNQQATWFEFWLSCSHSV